MEHASRPCSNNQLSWKQKLSPPKKNFFHTCAQPILRHIDWSIFSYEATSVNYCGRPLKQCARHERVYREQPFFSKSDEKHSTSMNVLYTLR